MKAVLLLFRGWLGLYFVLVHFVVPFYLVSIYPDVPEPAVRFMRGLGNGAIGAPPSELGFWYRFMACGAWVLMGLILLSHRIREIARESTERGARKAQRRRRRAV